MSEYATPTSGYLLRAFASRRRISRYSQISVTIRPNAPYHSMYFGAPMRTPVSIMSKSITRLSAGDDHHEHAERDAPGAAAVEDPNGNVKEAKQHRNEIKNGNAARCRDHPGLETLRGADDAALVGQE